MDAQTVFNSVTNKIIYELIIASNRVSLGQISLDDLTPGEIGKSLDDQALFEIQKGLQFAKAAAPALAHKTQERASVLIAAIRRERARAQGWQAQVQV